MRTVGGEYGGAYVSADLCCSEHASFAGACLALQRHRAAVPALVPALHCPRASCYNVTGSESGKAASGVVWSVLEEDVVLGFGAEMRHGCAESERGE
jgi:hypothetical protein